ncbi:MAG: glycosyltransferase [Candidatus Kerfeldbacteria bacterium]|nr:glycosyltransferase [Candidatus Kerfeldbacteria bacterium]
MRLLMISDHCDPLAELGGKEAGGQTVYVRTLAQFLSDFGVNVDVYTRWDQASKKEVVQMGPRWRVIRALAGPKNYVPPDQRVGLLDWFSRSILWRTKYERLRYDIIHSNYWPAGLIGLSIKQSLHLPLVHVYHSLARSKYEAMRRSNTPIDFIAYHQRLSAETTIAQHSSRIISTSPGEKQLIRQWYNVPGEKIDVIPIGINPVIFHSVNQDFSRRELGWSTKKKIILYVGRIEWHKGIGTLIEAMAQLVRDQPEVYLYIVGGAKSKTGQQLEAEEQQRLQNLMRQHKLDRYITFVGPKRQDELALYYSAADVTAIPSYYEPFGIVPLESMACGTPVVASRTGGMKYTMVDGETGYFAEPMNVADLARKINRILSKNKSHYTRNCIWRVQNQFFWPKIAQKYLTYFLALNEKNSTLPAQS